MEPMPYIGESLQSSSPMPHYLHNRHFTLEEARMVLPEVKSKMERLLSLKSKLDIFNYDIFKHEYLGGMGPNGSKYHPEELEDLVELIRYFEKEGILLKSIQEGLVDFPHIRLNDEEVYLCWKVGELDITFWHGLTDGFGGRRPVSQL